MFGKQQGKIQVDRRTFVIVAIILAVSLPVIIIVFRKSFFPILLSVKESLEAAAVANAGTDFSAKVLKFFK